MRKWWHGTAALIQNPAPPGTASTIGEFEEWFE